MYGSALTVKSMTITPSPSVGQADFWISKCSGPGRPSFREVFRISDLAIVLEWLEPKVWRYKHTCQKANETSHVSTHMWRNNVCFSDIASVSGLISNLWSTGCQTIQKDLPSCHLSAKICSKDRCPTNLSGKEKKIDLYLIYPNLNVLLSKCRQAMKVQADLVARSRLQYGLNLLSAKVRTDVARDSWKDLEVVLALEHKPGIFSLARRPHTLLEFAFMPSCDLQYGMMLATEAWHVLLKSKRASRMKHFV